MLKAVNGRLKNVAIVGHHKKGDDNVPLAAVRVTTGAPMARFAKLGHLLVSYTASSRGKNEARVAFLCEIR